MPSRQDPFGQYDHIKPVPMEQAKTEYKEAVKSFSEITEKMHTLRREYLAHKAKYFEQEALVQEKSWQLNLSALEE